MYAVVIRNGNIVDSRNATIYKGDIAVENGRIALIADHIEDPATSEVDATGCYVTPGLIDHHTHIYPLARIGTASEAVCFGAGVTTAVDAGSTGCETYEKYREWISMEKMGIRAYINVCSIGLDQMPEDVDPAHFNKEGLRELFAKYGDELLGLKLRTSRGIVKEFGWKPLEGAVSLGEELGLPLMVHITDPPGPIDELLERLRPGDIVTHMYQNKGYTLLKDGKVCDAAWKARERGVLFEAADAREHFSFEVSEPAIREGFYPDVLGTDCTRLSMHLRPTAFNMAMQISKYTMLGIPFPEIIKRASWNSAVNMGLDKEIGSLEAGKAGDIAVFRPVECENVFGDRPYGNPDQQLRTGHLIYEAVLTVKNGEMVYRNMTF